MRRCGLRGLPLRITDADGDALTKADDVATVASGYGTADRDHDGQASTPALKVPHKLFLYDLSQALTFNAGPTPAKGTLGTAADALSTSGSMHVSGAVANRDGTLELDNLPLTMVKVGIGGGTALAVDDVFAEPPTSTGTCPTTSSRPTAPARSRPGPSTTTAKSSVQWPR